jgi:hypothetical protein
MVVVAGGEGERLTVMSLKSGGCLDWRAKMLWFRFASNPGRCEKRKRAAVVMDG